MNDHQSKLMNQSQQMINQPKVMNQPKLMNPMSMSMPPQMMNPQQSKPLMNPPMSSQQMMNPQQSKPVMNQAMSSQQMMNQQQSKPVMNQAMSSQQMMMSRGGVVGVGGYGMWPLPPPHPTQVQEQLNYNPNVAMNFPGFSSGGAKALGRNNWKGKKGINDNKRRKGKGIGVGGTGGSGVGGGGGGYKPPNIKELQQENRLKARKYFQKKKFDKFGGGGGGNNRSAPYAPRNTSSFIIRAKKSGGIASLVSPCPVTPAVLPTPMFSPSTEVLGDMAKEEWGVDGYGSMNGLIRLRSPGDVAEDEEDEEGGGSSESDVEEHLEVERRLDHDLSRFEMIYPNYGVEYNNVLENRVDDQDTHIAQVEEENLILKERLFLMERELNDLRRRLLSLERQHQGTEEINEIVENESENDNGSRGEYSHSQEENNEEVIEENNVGCNKNVESKEEDNNVDDMVKDLNIVEAKKDNNSNNCGVEVNDGNNVDTEVGNDIANVEVKEANASEILNDAVVQDVCMDEVEPKQNGVNEEKANL
ncbi:uncharacterized protein LOC141683467 [Apium graveolens]|uniref:uncharacterized protein LOC141683467 n=1 Tax=Apium graveolens TaxID=4045 RepID=UPI003D79A9DE